MLPTVTTGFDNRMTEGCHRWQKPSRWAGETEKADAQKDAGKQKMPVDPVGPNSLHWPQMYSEGAEALVAR